MFPFSKQQKQHRKTNFPPTSAVHPSAFPTDHLIIEQAFPWVGCWGQSPFPLGLKKALFGSVCHHCCGWNWNRGTDSCGDSSPREKGFWLHLLADFSMKNKQQWFGFSILWIKQKQPHSWSEYRFLGSFSGPVLSILAFLLIEKRR